MHLAYGHHGHGGQSHAGQGWLSPLFVGVLTDSLLAFSGQQFSQGSASPVIGQTKPEPASVYPVTIVTDEINE
jgi:hypothetical protein